MFQNPIASNRMSRLIYELGSPRVSGLAVIDMGFLHHNVKAQEMSLRITVYGICRCDTPDARFNGDGREIGGEFDDTDTQKR